MWLLAISTGPWAGMLSTPSIQGLNNNRTNGLTTSHLSTKYNNPLPPSQAQL